jgi:hypothetical protein
MKMKTTNPRAKQLAKYMTANDRDWYAIVEDGAAVLKHQSGLSNILQCGQSPADFGITGMWRCGAESMDAAHAQIDAGSER